MTKPEVSTFTAGLIPKSVRILGKTYPVKVKRLSSGTWGQFQGPQQVIELSSTLQSMDEAVDTLLHEIIHAIEYNQGLDYDETRVRSTATGLIAILRDNPEIIPLLQGTYNEQNTGRTQRRASRSKRPLGEA